jgi:uncharacterized protein YpmB
MLGNNILILKRITIIILVILIFMGLTIIFCHTVKESNIRKEQMLAEKYEEGYLDACKDFYKGKTKYDLVKNDDGTVEWKKIEKGEVINNE